MDSSQFRETVESIKTDVFDWSPDQFAYRIVFVLPDGSQMTNDNTFATFMSGITYEEDYVRNSGCTKNFTISMSIGNYIKYIEPYKDNLRVLVRKVYNSLADFGRERDEPIKKLYTGEREFLCKVVPNQLDVEELISRPQIDYDKERKEFVFEMIDVNYHVTRMMKAQNIFRNTKVSSTIKYFFNKASQKVDERFRASGVSIEDLDNDFTKKQLILDEEVDICSYPRYLQERKGGLYNKGLGTFYKEERKRWYVYPLYDVSEPNKENLLNLFILKPNEMPNVENTHRFVHPKGQKYCRIDALCNGQSASEDIKQISYLNEGNGIKFVKASDIFNNAHDITSNVLTLKKDAMCEFVLEGKDKQNVNLSDVKVTDNIPREITKLAKRSGYYAMFTWNYARPDLLIPGMKVAVNYVKENKVIRAYGRLHKVIVSERRKQKSSTNNLMFSNVKLMVFMDDPKTQLRQM